MRKEEKGYYERLEEGRARVIPARNVLNLIKKGIPVCGIQPGEVGLVSAAQMELNKHSLVRVSCPDWDSRGFNDGDPIVKKAKAKEEAK